MNGRKVVKSKPRPAMIRMNFTNAFLRLFFLGFIFMIVGVDCRVAIGSSQ